MNIVCPNCRTAYEVSSSALGPDGRQVRCVRCGTIWFAELDQQLADAAPAAQSAPPRADPVPPKPEADIAVAGAESDSGDEGGRPGAVPPPPELVEMTATVTATAGMPSADQVEAAPAPASDAEPGPTAPDPSRSGPEPPAVIHIESVAAHRIASGRAKQWAPRPRWRVRKVVAAVLALAVIDAGLIIGRTEVVRVLPQTASLFDTIGMPVNLRNLAFNDIRTTQERHDGVEILVVEGTIVAEGRTVTDVPRLRFSLAGANGHEIYAWTALPTRSKLAPGETLPFRTRLASPPEQGRSVTIRFFTRHDLASGLP